MNAAAAFIGGTARILEDEVFVSVLVYP